MPKDQEQMSRN